MTDKQKLTDVLDNLVDGKPEMAQVIFHDYLRAKLTGTIGGKTETDTSEPNTDTTTQE